MFTQNAKKFKKTIDESDDVKLENKISDGYFERICGMLMNSFRKCDIILASRNPEACNEEREALKKCYKLIDENDYQESKDLLYKYLLDEMFDLDEYEDTIRPTKLFTDYRDVEDMEDDLFEEMNKL